MSRKTLFEQLVKHPKPGSRFDPVENDMDYDLSEQFTSSEEEDYEDELDCEDEKEPQESLLNIELGHMRQLNAQDKHMLAELTQKKNTQIRQYLQDKEQRRLLDENEKKSNKAFEAGNHKELDRLRKEYGVIANKARSTFEVYRADLHPSELEPGGRFYWPQISKLEQEIKIRDNHIENILAKQRGCSSEEESEYEESEEVSEYEEPVQVSRKRRVTRSMGKQPVSKKRKIIHISEDESE
jgi:hypothetical protein